MQNEVMAILGEEYNIQVKEVLKNNGVRLLGMTIIHKNHNISPTLYLDPLYRDFEEGTDRADIVSAILKVAKEDIPVENIDMSFFQDFDKVKEKLCYRLIHAQKNAALLEETPHIPYLDLAICFFYPYQHKRMGEGSITIKNNHMEKWGVSVKELWHAAHANTKEIYPAECMEMSSVLGEMTEAEWEDMHDLRREVSTFLDEEPIIPMKVLSNQPRFFGAGVILYEGFLEKVANQLGKSFFIFPSSIHEVVILEDNGGENIHYLKYMIEEINSTQVECQEVLSDKLYYYDKGEKKIRIIL